MFIEHSDKKYKVLKELGKGHSGTVYLGEDNQGRQVAIKCLAGRYNDATLKRFKREFVILRSLVHPNIAQPIDFGFDPRLKRYFFVAEYVRGVSLLDALADVKGKKALELFAQSLEALDYIHRNGVFHCDLKPANILVTDKGVLKLIDFDVASRGNKAIGGTPPYLPPELVSDLQILPNPRTDLFSLGVTFYQCLTRQKPFPARNLEELRELHATLTPKFPSEMNAKLSPNWDGLVMGMMQKNPSRRYSTASAVLQQVHLLLGSKKDTLSAEDIEYRLGQHGAPIGKELVLEKAKEYLTQGLENHPLEERLWILESPPGFGASYVFDEIKTLAHLRGIPCMVWNQIEQNFPETKSFVWIVDDLSKMQSAEAREKFSRVVAKIGELFYKGEENCWWILFGDVSKASELPKELQPLVLEKSTQLPLRKWDRAETLNWMKDIFQVPDIPAFLHERICEVAEGSPKNSALLLRRYLENRLLLDRNGHWRKDLYQPTALFSQEFVEEPGAAEFENLFTKLPELEKELLTVLSLLYEPLAGEALEKIIGSEAVYPMLNRFGVQGLVLEGSNGVFQIANPKLKQFALSLLSPEETRKRYDALVGFAGREELKKFFSAEALRYYQAHGDDPELAAEGWAYFADLSSQRGLWESAFEYYSNAFDKTSETNIEKQFEYSVQRGKCLIQRNLLTEAKQFFKSLLVQFSEQRHSKPEIFAKIYERLGVIEAKKGNFQQAQDNFYQGLACLDPGYEPLEQYLALRNFLAGLDLTQGNFEAAIEEFQDTYEIAQAKLPWERRRILTNNDLGAALLKSGQFEAAVNHWLLLIEDYKNREDKGPQVRCLYQLGQAYLNRSEAAPALKYLQMALENSKGMQNFEMELRIDNSLANLYRSRDPDKSLEMYERALDASFQTQDAFSTGVVLLNMGFLLEAKGQYARAKHCLNQGLNHLAGLPDAEAKYFTYFHAAHLGLARIAAELLQAPEALKNANRAHQLMEEHGLEEESFDTLSGLFLAQRISVFPEESAETLRRLRLLAKENHAEKLNDLQTRGERLARKIASGKRQTPPVARGDSIRSTTLPSTSRTFSSRKFDK